MKTKCFIFCLAILLVSSAIAAGEVVFKSTSNDQVMVELTIYNDNFALVKETRIVKLPVGEGKLNFRDIVISLKASDVLSSSAYVFVVVLLLSSLLNLVYFWRVIERMYFVKPEEETNGGEKEAKKTDTSS